MAFARRSVDVDLPEPGRSYRLRNPPPAMDDGEEHSKPANPPTGLAAKKKPKSDQDKPAD